MPRARSQSDSESVESSKT